MGEIADRLSAEIRESMKSGDKTRLGTVRMLATSVKHREVELGRDLTEGDLVEVVARQVKQRKEAASAYEDAGRADRAEQERAEQTVLEAYLPAQLTEKEVRAVVEEAIAATGATDPKEVGKVMGFVMAKHKGEVDGSLVNRLARERLGEG